MSLLRHQLDLHWQTKKKVEKMSLFVIFVYLKSWFGAPSLTAAATEDLELYSRLHKFRTVHSKVSSTTTSVLQRHTWYLTEELIPLSLFNENLPLESRTVLASKIGQLTLGPVEIRKPSLPWIGHRKKYSNLTKKDLMNFLKFLCVISLMSIECV